MNRLKTETSPYLLQHKNNPVHWFPWGEEALNEAKKQDKIIILSVGYSACHWCHVMEHECFEDREAADFMNRHFISIKVDREERPDIDHIYMEAVQNMGIRGGWPLNVFLLPTGEPFYGGTYFPKPKWMEVLRGLVNVYTNDKQKVLESARGFANSLNIKDSDKYNFGKISYNIFYTKEELRDIATKVKLNFDEEHGGLNRNPKFPMPSIWNMLLDLNQINPDKSFKVQLNLTLERMVLGGLFDHLGGGWTRYSTDPYWKVPHFEKMLYDNAQLIALYAKATAVLEPNELFSWAVELTYNWLKTDMSQKEGGFYSAQDADSEGEEGKFYVWNEVEIQEILKEDSETFIEAYAIAEAGNWEDEKNILHLEQIPENWNIIRKSHEKLLKIRETRVYPGLDNKILTSWNAMMVSGLIKRSEYLGSDYSLAQSKIDFLNAALLEAFKNEDGEIAYGLLHQTGAKYIPGFLDDYATMIQANVDMYSVSFEENYLWTANKLTKYVLANFNDVEEMLFFYTDIQSEKLIARKKEIFDNVIPSSNSMLAKSLYFLGRYLSKQAYLELAKAMFSKMKDLSLQDPLWLSNWVDLGLILTMPQKEVVVSGADFRTWLRELRKSDNSPATLFFGAESESSLPVFEGRFSTQSAAYICLDNVCKLPVYTLEKAKNSLNED